MAAIEVGCIHKGHEELGSVCAWASIGHRQGASALMLQVEVLVFELVPVDGLSARAISIGEVAALRHEVWNDAVELGALEVQRLARLTHAHLTSAKRTEVL